ncbi:hypothetical protein PROFUN_10693 [Planoprotostelium fungivorum]|uniref:UBX domain-containing protein n=1 Tax=Planoprotostelium fungivorum TaxID=1890364 RepID=A0A2P6N9K0_9EUKA|nr:hypothetical protein PROFUN_10693 [Planoprotostelium fungivorum]
MADNEDRMQRLYEEMQRTQAYLATLQEELQKMEHGTATGPLTDFESAAPEYDSEEELMRAQEESLKIFEQETNKKRQAEVDRPNRGGAIQPNPQTDEIQTAIWESLEAAKLEEEERQVLEALRISASNEHTKRVAPPRDARRDVENLDDAKSEIRDQIRKNMRRRQPQESSSSTFDDYNAGYDNYVEAEEEAIRQSLSTTTTPSFPKHEAAPTHRGAEKKSPMRKFGDPRRMESLSRFDQQNEAAVKMQREMDEATEAQKLERRRKMMQEREEKKKRAMEIANENKNSLAKRQEAQNVLTDRMMEEKRAEEAARLENKRRQKERLEEEQRQRLRHLLSSVTEPPAPIYNAVDPLEEERQRRRLEREQQDAEYVQMQREDMDKQRQIEREREEEEDRIETEKAIQFSHHLTWKNLQEEAAPTLNQSLPATSDTTLISVRLPNGKRINRRFSIHHRVGLIKIWIYNEVEKEEMREKLERGFNLATTHPRRELEEKQTLLEAGLQSCLLVVELPEGRE